ncbi:MAG: adenylate kinase family protein [Methanomethylophilus sp.]|nr:adenylate kinase family protein [Methanomethylophilus sp.]MDD4222708.1 adenylate kinase family protein [Methanomethylophilus sp.]MDD4668634.1 adenylate kinase family protein [Methanomethylophilus sp.]
MTVIALTGTPGVGKTSVSAELRRRGYAVVDINEHLKKYGLLGERDVLRDTYNVDMDALNSSLAEYRAKPGLVFLDSHLSHETDCSRIIVLRCEPHVLAERLRARGYAERKVRENVQAEVLDVILCEATDTEIPVNEIDCTYGKAADAAVLIERIIKGEGGLCPPGKVDWSGEMEEWF